MVITLYDQIARCSNLKFQITDVKVEDLWTFEEPNDSVIVEHITTFKCHIMFIFFLLFEYVVKQLLSFGQPYNWDYGWVVYMLM
jgi:hypothetical protein